MFTMKYVANENGFQPESSFLPVAPAFPHPIPQFVIEQIEFAKEEERKKLEEEIKERELQASAAATQGYHIPEPPPVEPPHVYIPPETTPQTEPPHVYIPPETTPPTEPPHVYIPPETTPHHEYIPPSH